MMYLDATKRWPLPSASFQYVVCEHMITQVTYDAGLAVMREARRVLLPRGVLRISTEDLDVVRRLPDSDDPEARRYIEWSNRTFGTPSQQIDASNPAHVLNRLMRSWGNTYLYDEATMRSALDRAGFVEVVRCKPDESLHPELARVDRHATLIGEVANQVESMIFEATAP
jgi:predicted SAM-dependent methyltransferase